MLEIGEPHADSNIFGLIGTGNYTAVIIGKHHHRFVRQIRPEETFTGNIEIVAVYESECFFTIKLLHHFSQGISTGNHIIITEKTP